MSNEGKIYQKEMAINQDNTYRSETQRREGESVQFEENRQKSPNEDQEERPGKAMDTERNAGGEGDRLDRSE